MPESLQIIAPDPKVHSLELADLLCKCFGTYADRLPLIPEILQDGFYNFAASRIGIMDGKIVTHFGVYDYQMRVGTARLRTAGIGSVATHPSYRKRGLMDLTAKACIEGASAAGFDFSVLFGIENFYDRFGYTRAWSDYVCNVALADLPAPPPSAAKGKIREIAFERRADLLRLFNRYHAAATGSAVRPTYSAWNLRKKTRTAYEWKNGRGQTAGYIVLEDQGSRIDVVEAVGDAEMILKAAAFAAQKCACDDVRFVGMWHESALARRLRRGNFVEHVHHHRNGNALGRVVHLPRALGKMEGEFSRRLRAAGLADYRGAIAIATPAGAATVVIGAGAVKMTEEKVKTTGVLRAGHEVSQLFLGTGDPMETAEAHRMRVSGDAGFLVRALFPVQYPTLPAGDHF